MRRSYLLANSLIEEVLALGPSVSDRITLSFIRIEIQRKLQLEYSHQEEGRDKSEGLDISKYVKLQQANGELKDLIREQVKLQIGFWHKFLSTKPDMKELFDISDEIHHKKETIQKLWAEFLRVRDKLFISPFLMYGMYSSLSNNDHNNGEKLMERYQEEARKLDQISKLDELTERTLFCKDTVQISMSGSRTKIGSILDCSIHINQVFAWKRESLVGKPVVLTMSKFYQEKHDGFLLDHYRTGNSKFLNRTVPVPVKRGDGYVSASWMHIKMNPFVELGISYISLIKPMKAFKLMVLVRKDGTLDGMSKDFAREMRIINHDENKLSTMADICPDFLCVDNAFNLMGHRMIALNRLDQHLNKQTETLTTLKVDKNHSIPEQYSVGEVAKMSQRHLIKDQMGQMDSVKQWSMNEMPMTTPRRRHSGTNKSGSSQMDYAEMETSPEEIYEKFTTGSILKFYPQKGVKVQGNRVTTFHDEAQREVESVLYNVKISLYVYGKDFLKVLCLEKVPNGDNKKIRTDQNFLTKDLETVVLSPMDVGENTKRSDKATPYNLYTRKTSIMSRFATPRNQTLGALANSARQDRRAQTYAQNDDEIISLHSDGKDFDSSEFAEAPDKEEVKKSFLENHFEFKKQILSPVSNQSGLFDQVFESSRALLINNKELETHRIPEAQDISL